MKKFPFDKLVGSIAGLRISGPALLMATGEPCILNAMPSLVQQNRRSRQRRAITPDGHFPIRNGIRSYGGHVRPFSRRRSQLSRTPRHPH
jgi:hypothetical protein